MMLFVVGSTIVAVVVTITTHVAVVDSINSAAMFSVLVSEGGEGLCGASEVSEGLEVIVPGVIVTLIFVSLIEQASN